MVQAARQQRMTRGNSRTLLRWVASALVLLCLGCASVERGPPAAVLGSSAAGKIFQASGPAGPAAVDIHYEEVGSGQRAAIFLHGFGSSLRNWDDVRDLLDPTDLQLVFLDLKGFGLSTRSRDDGYSLSHQAAIVRELIEVKGYRSVVLVGHSYGGAVALATAVLLEDAGRGELVEQLILIDSAAYAAHLPLFIDLLRTPVLGRLATWLLPRRQQLRIMLKKAFFDDRLLTPEILDRYVRCYRLPGSRYTLRKIARQAIAEDHADLERRLATLAAPAHLIWGRHDRMLRVETGERLAKQLRAKSFAVIEECGHIPQEEKPAETAAILKGLFAELQ